MVSCGFTVETRFLWFSTSWATDGPVQQRKQTGLSSSDNVYITGHGRVARDTWRDGMPQVWPLVTGRHERPALSTRLLVKETKRGQTCRLASRKPRQASHVVWPARSSGQPCRPASRQRVCRHKSFSHADTLLRLAVA